MDIKKLLQAGLCVSAVTLSGWASASPITFDWTSGGDPGAGTDTNLGADESWTVDGLTVTATFWSGITYVSGSVTDALASASSEEGYWDSQGGLGVAGNTSTNVDFDDDAEGILFTFAGDVEMISTFLLAFPVNEQNFIETDIWIDGIHLYDNGYQDFNLDDTDPGVFNVDTLLSLNSTWGTRILIANRDGGSGASQNDAFRVGALTVDVPEPTSIALLSLGLVGLGVARRKRKT